VLAGLAAINLGLVGLLWVSCRQGVISADASGSR
jgi:hypothetical protein